MLNKKSNRLAAAIITALFTVAYVLISNGILFGWYKEYEAYDDLKKYNITLTDEYYISGFISTEQGSAEITKQDGKYKLKLTGIKKATYKFGLSNGDDKNIRFIYYFDEDGKIVLKKDKQKQKE